MLKWPKGVTPTQEFEAALVKRERRHLFVTGRAGDGQIHLAQGPA
jgi:hypothetical protein